MDLMAKRITIIIREEAELDCHIFNCYEFKETSASVSGRVLERGIVRVVQVLHLLHEMRHSTKFLIDTQTVLVPHVRFHRRCDACVKLPVETFPTEGADFPPVLVPL